MIDGAAGLMRVTAGQGSIPVAVVAEIIEKTLHETPPEATHWTVHDMTKIIGMPVNKVQKTRCAHGRGWSLKLDQVGR